MIHYKADIRSLLFVALYFTVAIAPWFLWQGLNNYEIAAFVIANCFFSFSCAVIVHNTIHKPIFKSRVLNRMMQLALSLTYGHPVSAFVAGHNFSHHKYTQKPKDAMRTSKMRFNLNILNQLFFLPRMSGDILVAEIRFAKKMRLENPAWFRQYIIELVLVLGVKVVAFIINWKCALLFMVLPHYYAAWGIVGTNYFQHDGCDEDHAYNHSRSFSSKYLNWFLFNNGYHGAHHQRPALHWSLLPEYHDKEIRPFLHPSLDRVSLFAYLWRAHVYPGKRIDYLGNLVQLSPPEKEEDWVADVNPSLHREDLAGAA